MKLFRRIRCLFNWKAKYSEFSIAMQKDRWFTGVKEDAYMLFGYNVFKTRWELIALHNSPMVARQWTFDFQPLDPELRSYPEMMVISFESVLANLIYKHSNVTTNNL